MGDGCQEDLLSGSVMEVSLRWTCASRIVDLQSDGLWQEPISRGRGDHVPFTRRNSAIRAKPHPFDLSPVGFVEDDYSHDSYILR